MVSYSVTSVASEYLNQKSSQKLNLDAMQRFAVKLVQKEEYKRAEQLILKTIKIRQN